MYPTFNTVHKTWIKPNITTRLRDQDSRQINGTKEKRLTRVQNTQVKLLDQNGDHEVITS